MRAAPGIIFRHGPEPRVGLVIVYACIDTLLGRWIPDVGLLKLVVACGKARGRLFSDNRGLGSNAYMCEAGNVPRGSAGERLASHLTRDLVC